MFNETDAQTYLEQKYPTPEDKVNCKLLNLGTKNENNPKGLEVKLTGSLDLTSFSNLKILICNEQKITKLNLKDCSRLEELECWENELTELNLSNCFQLKKLDCDSNKLTNLDLVNCKKLESLLCKENQFIHLDLRSNKKLIEVECNNNQLTNLEIKSPTLTMLACENNRLSTLNLTNCSQLTELRCQKNQLTQLTFPQQLTNLETLVCWGNFLTDLDWAALPGEKLTALSLASNNFSAQDLSFLTGFTNLKELYLQNLNPVKISQGIYNRWTGSLQPLQNMKHFHTLWFDNTDLARGTEYLPTSVLEINCSYSLRPNSKVKLITQELEQNDDFMLVIFSTKLFLKKKLPLEILKQIKEFNHLNLTPQQEKLLAELIPGEEWRKHYKENGLCANCWQLNGWGGWCQPCSIPHLRANFANWTSGNIEIDKLIQKCQLEARSRRNLLEWIPYEQFSDIEYLATGGFSKIYRAIWIGGSIKGWSAKDSKLERWGTENIVLKSLTNSQNMSTEFLQEITNHKSVTRGGASFIVDCFGISQDPATGNYVMVMEYMEEGNLRQFLQRNYQQLSFPDRLHLLFQIIQGLQSVHQADLVHQDFHAGNVLNYVSNNHPWSPIADLGLSRPTNKIDKEQIYGVLPYVAPEVLRGEPHTQASDIYSFGMIAYELFSNQPPFADYAHDSLLALRICEGLRPNLGEVIAPQLLKDLISRCWDADPEQRPTASELYSILRDWLDDNFFLEKNTEFYHQYQELLITKKLDLLTNNPPRNYSADKYTSRLLDFPNLPHPQNSSELNKRFWNFWNSSEFVKTLEFGFTELIGSSETKRQLSISSQTEIFREGVKMVKLSDEQELQFEPEEIEKILIDRWKKINSNFTSELVSSWTNYGFNPVQCQDWININSPAQQNLAIQEPEYYAWLRDGKQVDSDWVHNYGDNDLLQQEFRKWKLEQLKAEVQIPPKNNLN